MIAPNFDAFPEKIRHLLRYVVWRYIEETKADGTKKLNKVPFVAEGLAYDRHSARGASSVDPSTWCSLAQAIATYNQGDWDGVMFALHESGFIGVDTDHSRNVETGDIDPRSDEIIHRIGSYTEISVSGTGIHALVEGILPAGGRKFGAVEMYDSGRFLVMTGAHLAGTPTTIEPRQRELEQLHADVTVEYSVEKRLGKDAKFRALWEGDTAGYESQSSADLALCGHLGRLCKGDVAQIDRMFRQSKLYRDKWERQDYRERTIAKALEGGITFTPRTPSDDEVAELERLRAENTHLRTIITKQDQEIQHIKAHQRWQNDLIQNPYMSAADKVTVLVTYADLAHKESAAVNEPSHPVNYTALAERSGQSPDTISRCVKKYDGVAWTSQKTKTQDASGAWRTTVRLTALPALAERPQELQPTTPRNHGGYRSKAPRPAPSCPEHADDAPVIEETTVVKQHLCGVCETTLGEPVFTQKRVVIWDPHEDVVDTGPQVAALKYGIHSSSKTLPTEGQVAARSQRLSPPFEYPAGYVAGMVERLAAHGMRQEQISV